MSPGNERTDDRPGVGQGEHRCGPPDRPATNTKRWVDRGPGPPDRPASIIWAGRRADAKVAVLDPAARASRRDSAGYPPTASERASARKGRTETVASERASWWPGKDRGAVALPYARVVTFTAAHTAAPTAALAATAVWHTSGCEICVHRRPDRSYRHRSRGS